MLKYFIALGCAATALAQQYTINTAAGGSPPPTPASAGSTSIGQPSRVAVDSAGSVYFSASHTVFRLSTAGQLTVVAGNSRAGFSGDGGQAVRAQLNNPQGIAIDRAGNIYIADAGNNRVRKVTDGVITTFAGNGSISPGGPRTFNDGGLATDALMHLPQGVAVDAAGKVYIAVTGDNNIRIVGTDGIIQSFAGNSFPSWAGDGGNAVDAALNKPSDLAIDKDGNVLIADTANAMIRKVTTDGKIATVAGSGVHGFAGDGADATKAAVASPLSVTVDSAGNFYIVSNADSRIRKVDAKGIITTIAGTGQPGFAGDGSAADKAQMNYPTGITADGSNNLYVADSLNLRIRKISGSNISSVAGNGKLAYSGDGGAAANAQLDSPQAVAVDAAGNLYIADTGNNVVRRVARGGAISTFAGNGQVGSGGDNGAATSAQLNTPLGVAVDAAGNVYIADSQNGKVRRVGTNGTIATVAGNGTQGFGGDNGAATSAQLYTPTGVAVDAAGNLYIADFNNNRVRRVSVNGTIATVAGTGNSGFSGDGGAATSAQLNLPRAVAVDAAGNLYIADSGNNRIRLVNSSGGITTFAGNGLPGFAGDNGQAIRAQVGNPQGVAVDAAGNVYVADGAGRVRKIYSSGFIQTVAGGNQRGYSGDGGSSLAAALNAPSGVALDATGNVYIADTGNNAVRSLEFTGYSLTLSAVTNGASNQLGPIAPGEIVVLWGTGIGPGTLAQAELSTSGLLGTTLAGTRVFFNGAPAPLLYTSSNQLAAFVPYEVAGTRAQVLVQYQGQVAAPLSVDVAPSSPGLFTLNATGSGQVLAINQDGSINDAEHRAPGGSYVTLYATGEGQTNPPGENGKPAALPVLPLPLLPVSATIGGRPATVQYAGGAPGFVAGLMQVNLQVPGGLAAGAATVQLRVGSTTSQANVTLYVTGN